MGKMTNQEFNHTSGKNKIMNNIKDKAYKLAASFYLSSMPDDWTGERIRKAILSEVECDDDQAIADRKEIELWLPIERHINDCFMSEPAEELDDLIQSLASSLLQFAKENQAVKI
jgi:hypothetical protein